MDNSVLFGVVGSQVVVLLLAVWREYQDRRQWKDQHELNEGIIFKLMNLDDRKTSDSKK